MKPKCKLCALGVGLVPELSQREVGAKYGVGKSSVGRHRKHLDSPVNDEGLVLVGKSVRDPETGSWARYKATTGVPEISTEDLEQLFAEPVAAPPRTARAHSETLSMADLQIGKAMERGGGTPETIAKVRKGIATFAEEVKQSQPECVFLADAGDSIEGIFNTPAQMVTNDLDVPAQIRTARRLFAEAIRAVAPLAPRIIFGSVPSNHGQFRTGYKSPGGTSDADFGLDINEALEEVFEDRPGFEHVEFVRPDPLDDTLVVEMSGTKIAVNHGYHSKNAFKHGEWWAKQDHGRRTGWDADILLAAHYHSLTIYQSGNGRWVIQSSSADPGSEWFTKITGESSVDGMTAFSVSDGMWSNVRIV